MTVLGKLVPGLLHSRLGLAHPKGRGLQHGALNLQVRLGVLDVLAAHQQGVAGPDLGHAPGLAFGAQEVGLRLRDLGLRLVQVGLAAVECGLVAGRVEAQEDLALLHVVAFLDEELGDARGDVGADVDLPGRAHVAARGDGGDQIAVAHRVDPDRCAVLPAEGHADGRRGRHNDDQADSNEDFNTCSHGLYGFLKGMPTTASSSAIAS